MSSADSGTNLSLLGALAFSDQEAWTRFVHLYQPLIYRWCRRRGLRHADAEDVSQTVLLKLLKTLPRFVYDPERRFRNWLVQVVQSAIANFWKTEQRRPVGQGGEIGDRLDRLPDPLSLESDPLMLEIVDRLDRERGLIRQAIGLVMERIQPSSWQAFWLTTIEGRSAAEVAESLDMAVTAVYMARSRAMKQLREELTRLRGTHPQSTVEPWPIESPLESVPGFRIEGELGRGGMGVVYRAVQLSLERTVAVKMLHAASVGDDQERERFWTEVQAAAPLVHQYIVPIFTVGEHAGRPYFSMKLVEGGSLAQHLPRFRKDPRSSARLLAAVAQAVGFAHGQRIVHRDLKPGNILLDDGDTPLVADFGLAQRLDDVTYADRGLVLGTPSYMAPEQAEGRTAEIGPTTDVYGLGAVLYEMLTGVPPFRADTPVETLVQVLEETPLPPRELRSSVPRELEAICLRCLEKLPKDRYASAEELADDLTRASKRG